MAWPKGMLHIRRLVEILKEKARQWKADEKDTEDEAPYETGPLSVKSTLSRKEIYDWL